MGEMLFSDLPVFPVAPPDDELRMLRALPDWPSTREVVDEDHATCRRLERKRLIKVSREKMDPVAIRPTWFAGRIVAPGPREVARA